MKLLRLLAYYGCILCIFTFTTGCEKESAVMLTPVPPVPPAQPRVTPPSSPPIQGPLRIYAQANVDVTIEEPLDFAILFGRMDGTYNIPSHQMRFKWIKISGPASAVIAKPDSLITRMTNLQEGVYELELEVSAPALNMAARDTMNIRVEQASSTNRQVLFRKLEWSCPWDCALSLFGILDYVPANAAFTVYIRREHSTVWEDVRPLTSYTTNQRYFYEAQGGGMTIYEIPFVSRLDRPEVKIVF